MESGSRPGTAGSDSPASASASAKAEKPKLDIASLGLLASSNLGRNFLKATEERVSAGADKQANKKNSENTLFSSGVAGVVRRRFFSQPLSLNMMTVDEDSCFLYSRELLSQSALLG